MATKKNNDRSTETVTTADVGGIDISSPGALVVGKKPGALAVDPAIKAKLDRLRDGDFERRFVKIRKVEPGKPIEGVFLGIGEYLWVEDPADNKKENRIATWKIQTHETLIEGIFSASQLDKKMPYYPIGGLVSITLLQEKGTSKSNRRFSDFLISEPEEGWLSVPHCTVDATQKRDKVG